MLFRSEEFAPYQWSYQDAEALKYADAEFDWCVVHNGLHHCYSPHRALLEMYRVARKGIVVFEPRDTLLVRVGVRLGLGQEYEVASVWGNNCQFGGVRNTAIPNYVYRWTEREVEKTLCCFEPLGRPRVRYFYALRVPEERLRATRNKWLVLAARLAIPVAKLLAAIFPRQSNCFAMLVEKPVYPQDLHPWLAMGAGGPTVNRTWLEARYAAGANKWKSLSRK